MHFSEGKVMVTSCQKRSADQAPNGINGGGVAGPFMPAWCLICAALLACLSPAPPTKSLDLSLTLTNNVIHVNDVPEHLLTMYPVCTLPRVRRYTFIEREQAHKKAGISIEGWNGFQTCSAGAHPYRTTVQKLLRIFPGRSSKPGRAPSPYLGRTGSLRAPRVFQRRVGQGQWLNLPRW